MCVCVCVCVRVCVAVARVSCRDGVRGRAPSPFSQIVLEGVPACIKSDSVRAKGSGYFTLHEVSLGRRRAAPVTTDAVASTASAAENAARLVAAESALTSAQKAKEYLDAYVKVRPAAAAAAVRNACVRVC